MPGGVPALLSPEEWQRVCALREQSRKSAALYNTRRVYPLSGLVFCASCGSLMPLNYGGKDRSGAVQRYYTCRSSCCRPARLEGLQDAVFTVLENMALSKMEITTACAVANSFSDAADEDHAAEARAVDQQVIGINKRIASIVSFISDHGSAAPASLADDLRRMEKERDDLQARAASLRRPATRYNAPATVAAITACAGIKKQPPDQQKLLLQAAVHKVSVSDEEYRIVFSWHTGGGDEPPHPVSQSFIRHRR